MFGFDMALLSLKTGHKVQRAGWNGKGMWVNMQVPDANSKMTRPYLYIRGADGFLRPWAPSQADLLDEDWSVFDG